MNLESAIVIFRLTVCTISGCVRQRQMTQEGAAEYARKTQSRQITEFRANKLLRHLFSANSETRKINRLIRRYSNGLSGAEAEEGEDGGTNGEYAGKEHRVMRSLVPEEMEKQGHEGSTGETALLTVGDLITDTTFTNIVCEDSSGALLTPASPLLQGTMRQHLLDSGLLRKADIRPEDLPGFTRIHLINAMNGLGDLTVAANSISHT